MRSFGLQIGLVILALISGSGAGQSVILPSWPARTLSLITPAPPGGAVDLTARVAGDKLAERLGRPVVVDSRPGADGIIAAEAFLSARDKDHTFLVTFGGLLINNPVSYEKLPYDPERDFVQTKYGTTGSFLPAIAQIGCNGAHHHHFLGREVAAMYRRHTPTHVLVDHALAPTETVPAGAVVFRNRTITIVDIRPTFSRGS